MDDYIGIGHEEVPPGFMDAPATIFIPFGADEPDEPCPCGDPIDCDHC